NISTPLPGTLSTLSVKQGDTVTSGQTIGTVTGAQSSTGVTGKATSLDLTSPIGGTVVQVQAVQNQGVTPGVVIAQIADLNNLTITAYVDETSISNVKVGQD